MLQNLLNLIINIKKKEKAELAGEFHDQLAQIYHRVTQHKYALQNQVVYDSSKSWSCSAYSKTHTLHLEFVSSLGKVTLIIQKNEDFSYSGEYIGIRGESLFKIWMDKLEDVHFDKEIAHNCLKEILDYLNSLEQDK